MPGEVGNLGTLWAKLVRAWHGLGAMRPDRWQHSDFANRRQGKKRFSARFPLILDDMILRDFVMYLAMILATLLILASCQRGRLGARTIIAHAPGRSFEIRHFCRRHPRRPPRPIHWRSDQRQI